MAEKDDYLVDILVDLGFVTPEQVADEIFLLLEGARVNVQSVGREGPGTRIGEMLCSLLRMAPRKEQRP